MQRTGIATLPLHPGNSPPWLFKRMVALGREIVKVIIFEYGTENFIEKISDPFWFQSLSCILGFDWHSSGTTTVTLGALKVGTKNENLGIKILGGKGKSMRKTPSEIEQVVEEFNLKNEEKFKYASRMCAKVDNNAVQSGHRLYHHSFIMDEKNNWAVIEQGMRKEDRTARRYHWLGREIQNWVVEPHKAIVGMSEKEVLNMIAKESDEARKISVDIAKENPVKLQNLIVETKKDQTIIEDFGVEKSKHLRMPFSIPWGRIRKIYEFQPRNYEELLSMEDIGPSTIRALALISEVIYDKPPSRRDPIRYSFAVGGKDGVPFPVDRIAMDRTTEVLKSAVENAKIGNDEKLKAVKRLEAFIKPRE